MFVAYTRGVTVYWLSPFTFPCCAHVVPHRLSVVLAVRMPVPGAPLRFVCSVAKDGRPYECTSPAICFFQVHTSSHTHPLASFPNGLGCTLLQHNTLHALLPSPTPRQESSPVGSALAPHRLAPCWLHPGRAAAKGL